MDAENISIALGALSDRDETNSIRSGGPRGSKLGASGFSASFVKKSKTIKEEPHDVKIPEIPLNEEYQEIYQKGDEFIPNMRAQKENEAKNKARKEKK